MIKPLKNNLHILFDVHNKIYFLIGSFILNHVYNNLLIDVVYSVKIVAY